MYNEGSSSRTADAGNTPSVMGTVICFPVRSSVIVMVSGTRIVPLVKGPVVRVGQCVEACSSTVKDNQRRASSHGLRDDSTKL